MAVCRKSYIELSVALLLLIGCAASTGFGVIGVYWNQYSIHNSSSSGFPWIITGNVLNVLFTFAAIAVLYSTPQVGNVAPILTLLMFIGIVTDLYATVLGSPTGPSAGIAYTLLGFNALPRFVAILMGYGVCSIDDVVSIVGGKFRR